MSCSSSAFAGFDLCPSQIFGYSSDRPAERVFVVEQLGSLGIDERRAGDDG